MENKNSSLFFSFLLFAENLVAVKSSQRYPWKNSSKTQRVTKPETVSTSNKLVFIRIYHFFEFGDLRNDYIIIANANNGRGSNIQNKLFSSVFKFERFTDPFRLLINIKLNNLMHFRCKYTENISFEIHQICRSISTMPAMIG